MSRFSRFATGRSGARRHPSRASISPPKPAADCTSSMSVCGRGVELVAEARADGVDVTCETCPHYLLLTDDRHGATRRGRKVRAAAARSARAGRTLAAPCPVATIGSDHSPAPPDDEDEARISFEVWGGISGCQHLLPLLVDSGKLSPPEIIRLTSESVATRFRLPTRAESRSERTPI